MAFPEPSTQFKPGNPGGPGRPSKMAVWREKVEAEFEDWVQVYINARDSDDQALAMKAADTVFDRLYGKATQPLEHSGQVQLNEVLFADALPVEPLELESSEVDA